MADSVVREAQERYQDAISVQSDQRKQIAEENVLRYNGMLIGVFELLADSRDQIGAVISAIAAEQQFWLADAALQATLIGRPTSIGVTVISKTTGTTAASH